MKRFRETRVLSLLLTVCLISVSTGCSVSESRRETNVPSLVAEGFYNPDYTIGVVKTRDSAYSSYIEYYDEDLNLVNTLWYPYASLGDGSSYRPSISDDRLWMIPRGLMWFQNTKKAISLGLTDGTVDEYTVDQISLDVLTVDDRYVYVTNDLNRIGHITRVDIETKEVKTVDLPDMVPLSLICNDSVLYVFCLGIVSDGSDAGWMIRYNTDLKELTRQNLNELVGLPVTPGRISNVVGDRFFLFLHNNDESSGYGSAFAYSCYVSDGRLELFKVFAQGGTTSFLIKDRLLIVLVAGDALQPDEESGQVPNSRIDVYNMDSGELLYSLEILDFNLGYYSGGGVIRGDYLYLFSSRWDGLLLKYQISENGTLTEVVRTSFYTNHTPASPSSYYPSLIFSKE